MHAPFSIMKPFHDKPLPRRPWSARPTSDLVHFGFFASHLAATLLMDVPVLLTGAFEPTWASPLRSMLNQYLKVSGDPLMARAASSDAVVRNEQAGWFRMLLACEVGFQLPVFVYGGWRLWSDTVDETTETLLTVYGAHAATTLVPVLHALWTLPTSTAASGPISRLQRAGLMALYVPYLLVPVHMVWRYGFAKVTRRGSGGAGGSPAMTKRALS